LKTALSEPLDLILTDVKMPDLSGVELLERLRQAQLSTPVIFMTAVATSVQETVEFMKRGVCDILHKPVPLEMVVIAVERALLMSNPVFSLRSESSEALKQAITENAQLLSRLKRANFELKDLSSKLQHSSRKALFFDLVLVRFVYLSSAVITVFLLHHYGLISDQKPLLLFLILILFVLLSLPFDRVKTLLGKTKKSEAKATFR